MMKKNGFTLAEVLITLAIIGVVASLTLPSLMTNTQEQQAVTAFKKAMNTLNEVAQMNAALDGFDYGNITTAEEHSATNGVYDENGALPQSIWAMMRNRAQVDLTQSAAGGLGGACGTTYTKQVFFRDGTVLCYADTKTNGTANAYIYAVIDTNGRKAPNTLSTCNDPKCLGKNKAIRDQFYITLKGANALPGRITTTASGDIKEKNAKQDYASRWAMSK